MVERWKTLVKGWKGEEFEKSMMGALKALNPSFDLEVKNGNALMVSGESAGGFLAAYSMFRHEGPHISCSLLQYPMLKAYTRDAGSPYRDKSISMEQVQSFAEERMKEIEDLEKEGTLKNLERDASNPPEGMDMAYAMSSAKRDDGSSYWRYWFDHEDIMDTLDKGPVWRGHSPFIFLLHGGKDTNCHSSQTRHLVRFVNFRQFANAVLIERTTEAHGFDYSFEASDAAQANWLPTLISMVKVTWVLDPSPAELAMVAGKLENDETQTIYSKYHEDNEATISTSAMANRSLPERKSRFDDDNYVYKPLGPPPEDAQRLMVHESRNRARSK